ncbi:unnamed protein product [Symbiodinium sp. CCMP2592]|nr:unnamed protein product [Symbiodinium sp. CCMP2592]
MAGYVLPQILMTSELSMMPPLNNGGVTAWVARAFGGRVGECVGLNMLLYQIVDLATYTTIVTGYAQSGGYEVPSWLPTLAPFVVILLGLAVNLLALDVATEFLGASLVVVLLPFALGVPLALGQASVAWALATGQQPAAISEGGGGKGDVNLFLSSLVWLFTGWDSFGNLAEDVADPVHLVKGMLSAAVIALAVYFVCTFGALAAGPGTWQDGYLALAYGRLWAPLGPWICFSAALSNSLIYTSELAVTSRFLQSLGRSSSDLPRLLPGVLQKEISSGDF